MSTGTHPADRFITEYQTAFNEVYGQTPRVFYLGNQWYQVNGETTHHTIFVSEITRLRDLAKLQQRHSKNRTLISRLINKLRNM